MRWSLKKLTSTDCRSDSSWEELPRLPPAVAVDEGVGEILKIHALKFVPSNLSKSARLASQCPEPDLSALRLLRVRRSADAYSPSSQGVSSTELSAMLVAE